MNKAVLNVNCSFNGIQKVVGSIPVWGSEMFGVFKKLR